MSTILYTVHDATKPLNFGPFPKTIAHVCNNLGSWGAGFVLAIDKAFGPGPKAAYQEHIRMRGGALGDIVEYQELTTGTQILNMIAQDNTRKEPPYVDYDVLWTCFSKIEQPILQIPAIGVGIGGGEWSELAGSIRDGLGSYGCVVVCCLDQETATKLKEEDEDYPLQEHADWKEFLWHYNKRLAL